MKDERSGATLLEEETMTTQPDQARGETFGGDYHRR